MPAVASSLHPRALTASALLAALCGCALESPPGNPDRVGGQRNFAEHVVAASAGACALMRGGQVACWGAADAAEVARSDAPVRLVARERTELGGATAIATSDAQTCWGDRDGALRCSDPAGATLRLAAGSSPIVDVAIGDAHVCALRASGAVACVGENDHEQLGTAGSGTELTLGVTHALAAAADRTCAVVDDGVVCWGASWSRRHASASPLPVALATLARDIALSDSAACAAADGAVECWTDAGSPPEPVPGVERASRVALWGTDACAIVPADTAPAAVWCWSLASGAPTNVHRDDRFAGAVDLAVGDGFVCAVRTTGAVVCAGNNDSGQLGRGADGATATPTEVGTADGAWALADGYWCSLDAAGALTCVGQSTHRTLGPDAPAFGAAVVSAVAGRSLRVSGRAACVQTADHSFTCWDGARGPDSMVELSADDVATGSAFCTLAGGLVRCGAPGEAALGDSERRGVVLGSDAHLVETGSAQGCAATGTEVLCWGSDRQPVAVGVGAATALCVGETLACAATADDVRCWAPGGTAEVVSQGPVAELACGDRHACSLDAAGAVRCWGASDRGQTGEPRPSGTVLLGATRIAAAVDTSCAGLATGAVLCWGVLPFVEDAFSAEASPVVGLP